MKIRILIIDSEPRWIDFAKNDLGAFEIVIATDKETAIQELENDRFHLVIASSGYLELLDEISERFDKQVVVATVMPSNDEALDAYRKGAVRYITKSFQQQDLFNNIKELVPFSGN